MLDKWLESANTLYNMYIRLAIHDINGTLNSEEAKLIMSLLPDAIRFEKNKIDSLNFSFQNITSMLDELKEVSQTEDEIKHPTKIFDNASFISSCRIFNTIDSIDTDEPKLEEHPSSIGELICNIINVQRAKDKKFDRFYLNHISFNTIYMINLVKEHMTDDKLKEYLTKLLYMSIFINPLYEKEFILSKKIRKPINIKNYVYLLEDMKEEEAIIAVTNVIVNISYQSIMELLNMNDSDLNDKEKEFEYIKDLTELIARLISLCDINIINTVEHHITNYINTIENKEPKERIIKDIFSAIEYSKKYTNANKNEKKLENVKDNKTTN